MKETTPEKENGRPAPELPGTGPSTAIDESISEHKMVFRGSPFARCGHVVMEKDTLKISYDAFGTNHIVFICDKDLRALVRIPYAPPVPVCEIRETSPGYVTSQKIGHAHQSVSGQSLIISTTTGGGDLIISWSKLQQVVNRKIRSAPVSRIKDKAIIPPRPAVPAHDISAGLARGF